MDMGSGDAVVTPDGHTLAMAGATGVEWVRNSRTFGATAGREVILSAGALQSPQILQLSGVGPAELLRGLGIPVSVDIDTIYAGFDGVLGSIDYLIASSEFPVQWTSERDPFRALETIQNEYKMRVAAMTLGAHGALARVDNKFIYSPAFVVNCVDTTGAGDVFHGAFCYAVLEGMPMRETLEFSNAMAALNCCAS